ncbi:MAG: arginine deiminase-related protein, partial [Pseudomonadota bacterium]|nr:arginine deiminase-related protein [Pseudomonadota bacterium]
LYMAGADGFDADAASRQHRALHRAVSEVLPAVCFAGDPSTPDALFPNNVFGSASGRYIVGRMRHAVRQREAGRDDIRHFFADVLGLDEIDLSAQHEPCELTGSLVIDRSRGLGFAGLSERCSEQGARLMHDAFGLRATLMFDLAPGEYHTNVVLAVLAGRAALLCPDGFADAAVAQAIAELYSPHAVLLGAPEKAAFAANAIALSDDSVWMSRGAAGALTAENRSRIAGAGFTLRHVDMDAIEAAGGSLRCCIGEIY